jgi:hypothetical protein
MKFLGSSAVPLLPMPGEGRVRVRPVKERFKKNID